MRRLLQRLMIVLVLVAGASVTLPVGERERIVAAERVTPDAMRGGP